MCELRRTSHKTHCDCVEYFIVTITAHTETCFSPKSRSPFHCILGGICNAINRSRRSARSPTTRTRVVSAYFYIALSPGTPTHMRWNAVTQAGARPLDHPSMVRIEYEISAMFVVDVRRRVAAVVQVPGKLCAQMQYKPHTVCVCVWATRRRCDCVDDDGFASFGRKVLLLA